MPTGSTIALFLLAAAALAVAPGPAVAYIVTQSIDQGRRAGLVSALGVASGGLVHVAAATVGLSALIASSATAFTAVKLVGAAYLIVVGIRRILSGEGEEPERRALRAPLRRVYRNALVWDAIAGRIRRTGTGAKVRRWLRGGVFVALGVTAAAARRT
jgi:threonine/homoserine/homoserine lactone efflux protein